MEALDYSPSPLDFPKSVVLVEGKTDFFLLNYFRLLVDQSLSPLAIFRGGGAGSLAPLITLLSGWGKEFVVLLDSDVEGIRQKQRYEQMFESLVTDRLLLLSDCSPELANRAIESLICPADKELMRQSLFPEIASLTKKHLHRGVQELIAQKRLLSFSPETVSAFKRVFRFLGDALARFE
jgi:predicted ATP-dependent endonuclease of OLD family